jgi:sulfate/thiosulfate transport system substrate-binding protein
MEDLMRFILSVFAALFFSAAAYAEGVTLLNVSYDPTREFYQEYNKQFAAYWQAKKKQEVTVEQSHGGSGKQARAVIDGLEADVVTLALAYDIDMIAGKTGKIPADWQQKLPFNSTPYTSTVVFLVHKGNPKKINDWEDLVKESVAVITPNPKTSGGARWNYLAAWAYASEKAGGDKAKAEDFMRRLFKNVPMLDTGARAATTTFVQRGIGDVLITWENEAHLAVKELGPDKFDIVIPSLSILAEPSVAVVEGNAQKKKTFDAAVAYLQHLYDPQAQELAAKHYYRPRSQAVAEKYKDRFPELRMKTIADFGGWAAAQKEHFDDGGLFDRIYAP